MQEKIYDKGNIGKMIDKDLYNEELEPRRKIGSSLRQMERIEELRILLRATSRRLSEIQKGPAVNGEGIIKEKALLKAIQREIWRLKQHAIFLEIYV